MRYEDLVRSPDVTLRAMLSFLKAPEPSADRVACARLLAEDPSVKRVKKRAARELMGNHTPGLARADRAATHAHALSGSSYPPSSSSHALSDY